MRISEKQPRNRFSKLLVATDFSRGAEYALARAVRLPLPPGATIHLLHILPDGIPPELRARAETKALSQLKRAASEALREAKSAGNTGVIVTHEFLTGQPYIEIIQQARLKSADVVVIGRHGKRVVRDLFLGSTAMRVVSKGDFPVLVVNRSPSGPYQRPMVAVSLEDTSRAVLELASRALEPSAMLIPVVHAYIFPFEGFVIPYLPKYRMYCKKEATEGLKRILQPGAGHDLPWKAVVRPGDPRTVLVQEAVRRRTDLIVAGTHARSGLSHVLLGSVAEWLIRAAPCDILVSRPARFSFELP